MIPLGLLAFLSPLKKAASIALDVANAVPGWLWAAALLFVWLQGCSQHNELVDLRTTHANLVTSVEAQNTHAAQILKDANARIKALQDSLFQSAKVKDANDVNSLAQINNLAGQLRSARASGRLRDPNASGQSGASACTDAAPRSAPGDADRAQTAGLLSEQLTELLLADSKAADTINAAYIRCRSDYRELREMYEAWRTTLPAPSP